MVTTRRDSLLDGATSSDAEYLHVGGVIRRSTEDDPPDLINADPLLGDDPPYGGPLQTVTDNDILQVRTADGWRPVGAIAGGVIRDIERNRGVVSSEIDLDISIPQEEPVKTRKPRGPRIIIIKEDK